MKEYRYQIVCTRVTMQRFHLDNKGNEIAIVHALRRVSRQGVENNQAECMRVGERNERGEREKEGLGGE